MENIPQIIEKLEQEIKHLFGAENTGHDIYHLKRTFNLAMRLQKKEGGDKLVIAIAAFLHDIHRIIQKETNKFCSPEDSLPKIKEILGKVSLAHDTVDKVLHCIEFHEEYDFSKTGKTVRDIETLIIQDADNLDAIGAVGIARAFVFGGAHNIPIWVPEIPFARENYDESINDPSEIHHFYSKLLRLKDNMNTKTAKKIAQKRHKFLENYLKQLFKEWEGKN